MTASLNPFQQQAIESMKKQQDAYLEAVRAWRDAAGTLPDFADLPETPVFDAKSFESMPSAEDIAQQNAAFMTRAMEEQQRFLASLNDILGRTS